MKSVPLLTCILVIACNSSQPQVPRSPGMVLGKIFTFDQPVPIYSQPTANSEIIGNLPEYSEAAVFQVFVKDSLIGLPQESWCWVRSHQVTGYVKMARDGQRVMLDGGSVFNPLKVSAARETRIKIYQRPTLNSTVVGVLSDDQLADEVSHSWGSQQSWLGIRTGDGLHGYVVGAGVRYPAAATRRPTNTPKARSYPFNLRNMLSKTWRTRRVLFGSVEISQWSQDFPYFTVVKLRNNGKMDFFLGLKNCRSGTWKLSGKTLSFTLVAEKRFADLDNAPRVTLHFTQNSIGERESIYHKGTMLQALTLEGKYRDTPIKMELVESDGPGDSYVPRVKREAKRH